MRALLILLALLIYGAAFALWLAPEKQNFSYDGPAASAGFSARCAPAVSANAR